MALTAPTPPTPPTPPTVPKVTLGGGGSVTETQGPVSGQRSENDESQARAAVARGDGPLSRTTTEDPQDSNGNGQTASNAASQNGQNAQGQNANSAQQGGQQQGSDGSAALLGGDAGSGAQSSDDAQSAKEAQALEEGRVQHPTGALGSHGVLYIGFSLVTFVALAVLLYRWMKKRRAEHQGGLHYGDFAGDIDAGREEAAEDKTLRGRTAGEILGDIEREEERELAIARARAAEYQRQQAREQAARERRRQEREEAAARKEKEALRAKEAREAQEQPPIRNETLPKKQKKDEDDRPHFDLRA